MNGRINIAWLRFLDRVKPRPGIGGPSRRIVTATPAEARRIAQIVERCICENRPNEYRGRDGWWRCFDCDRRVEKIDA